MTTTLLSRLDEVFTEIDCVVLTKFLSDRQVGETVFDAQHVEHGLRFRRDWLERYSLINGGVIGLHLVSTLAEYIDADPDTSARPRAAAVLLRLSELSPDDHRELAARHRVHANALLEYAAQREAEALN